MRLVNYSGTIHTGHADRVEVRPVRTWVNEIPKKVIFHEIGAFSLLSPRCNPSISYFIFGSHPDSRVRGFLLPTSAQLVAAAFVLSPGSRRFHVMCPGFSPPYLGLPRPTSACLGLPRPASAYLGLPRCDRLRQYPILIMTSQDRT